MENAPLSLACQRPMDAYKNHQLLDQAEALGLVWLREAAPGVCAAGATE